MHIKELILSNSSLNLFRSCPRKLEFKKFYNHSVHEESLATLAGTALHAAYQNYLVHKDETLAIYTLMVKMKTQYDVSPLKPRSLQACYDALMQMIEYAESNYFQVAEVNVDGEIKPAVEVPFQINIKGFSLSDEVDIPVKYIGYIDLILYNILDKYYYTEDIKTHTKEQPDLTALYQFDDQCLPYSLVLEHMLGNEMEELETQYLSCFIKLCDSTVTPYPFTKTKTDISDWAQGFFTDLHLIKQFYNHRWFPRRGNNCVAWNRVCQYFDVCDARDEDTIEYMLESKLSDEPKPFKPWFVLDLQFGD